jgi:hypothetical protein
LDKLWKTEAEESYCGTLPHGYYDDIAFGNDYYTGHLVFESLGKPKVTDLGPLSCRTEEHRHDKRNG